jgi:translation initiation factor IF-2
MIPEHITVNDLAGKLDIAVTALIGELIKNGVMATVNDSIDFDTAEIIVSEVAEGVQLEKEAPKAPIQRRRAGGHAREIARAEPRPPVVAVMGHVDHGKTSLLDTIRHADVAEHEAGGITQHIAAYQIMHKKRPITFLDTPGHEAFSSLRQHGAYLTDLVMLVVAADDGVKPQTLEAIKYAQAANAPIMVALNKVDKPEANVQRVLQELNDAGLVPEQWGGSTIVVEVSAKQQTNVDKLLDMAFLITDVEELTADAEGNAEGIVIEGHMETGRGAVVTVLVEHGYLKPGAYLQAGRAFGKVRTLEDYRGDLLAQAGPSTPATITGLKQMPSFGVRFGVVKNEKVARAAAAAYEEEAASVRVASTSTELLAQIHQDRMSSHVPAIVKADVRGSVTSVSDALQSLSGDEVSVQIVGSGVGAVSESDVTMAAASGAIIYGFNVTVPVNVKRLAQQEGVSIRSYSIIYELIDDAKQELEALLSPEVRETNVGRLLVKGIFKTTKTDVICGGKVTKGKIFPGALVRHGEEDSLDEAEVTSVQRGQQEAKEVVEGEMCGLQLKTGKKLELNEGDKLDFFTREIVKRTL